MSDGRGFTPGGSGTPARVVGIGSAVALMVGAILLAEPYVIRREAPPDYPAATLHDPQARPIVAEAGVFRTRPEDLAPSPDAPRRKDAHPRTLAMWRATRAFPGAPPRIAHGLTNDEFRATACNSCHERGGWVERFASYVPVTPHPELGDCLQCHVPDDAVVGTRFPGGGQDALCFQCHAPNVKFAPFVEIDWKGPAWARTDQRALPEAPMWIPHDLQMRENCLACHMAPGGVDEIRTTHPERANCLQCHGRAPSPGEGEADVFERPSRTSTPHAGEGR